MKLFLYLLLVPVFLLGCKDPVIKIDRTEQKDSFTTKIDEQTKQNQSRDVWQQPEFLLSKLGDLSDKTIADIGAGTGFFTFRLLFKAKKVIAIDIDPTMLDILESFKVNLEQEINNKLETRLSLPNDPKIEQDEVDIAIIINTIGYINDRVEYIANLYQKLAPGGKLMIVDFKSRQLPIEAPSNEYRVPLFQIEKDLLKAGFNFVDSDDRSLDYQYIVIAEKAGTN